MTTTETHFIAQTAAARMPDSCWGKYRRVAVLEVDADRLSVSMISERATGCHRVVETWERLHVGTTERCAYQVALAEAEAMVAEMNGVAV